MRRISLLLLLIISISLLSSIDFVFDGTIGTQYAEEFDSAESYVEGEIRLNLVDKENVTADATYKITEDDQYFNVLQAKFSKGKFLLSVGRQQIGWGSGYNFNPTDVFNRKPLGASFDPSFSKEGRDAVVLTYYLLDDLSLEGVYGFAEKNVTDLYISEAVEKVDYDLGGRLKLYLFGYDIALSYVYRNNYLKGIDPYMNEIFEPEDVKIVGSSVSGNIPFTDIGFWNEYAMNVDDETYEMATGADYYFFEDYMLNVEYYRNTSGETELENYDFSRLYFSDMLAQNYLIPSLQWIVNEKYTLTGFGFINLDDKSSTIGGVIDYLYDDNIELIVSPYYLIGDEDTEFGSQKIEYGDYGIEAKLKLVY